MPGSRGLGSQGLGSRGLGRWRAAALASVLGGLGASASARAESVAAHADAYFYAAPRYNARVLDEVQRAVTLDVLGCESGWCRVRYGTADGYVRDEIVHGPENQVRPGDRPVEASCFEAAQPGGGAWQDEHFCRSGK